MQATGADTQNPAVLTGATQPLHAAVSGEDSSFHHQAAHESPHLDHLLSDVRHSTKTDIAQQEHKRLISTAANDIAAEFRSVDDVKAHKEPADSTETQHQPLKHASVDSHAFPDATHQLTEQKTDKASHFPDATHQVHARTDATHTQGLPSGTDAQTTQGHGGKVVETTHAEKPALDADFIQHKKWNEKDVKQPDVAAASSPSTPPQQQPQRALTGLYQLVSGPTSLLTSPTQHQVAGAGAVAGARQAQAQGQAQAQAQGQGQGQGQGQDAESVHT